MHRFAACAFVGVVLAAFSGCGNKKDGNPASGNGSTGASDKGASHGSPASPEATGTIAVAESLPLPGSAPKSPAELQVSGHLEPAFRIRTSEVSGNVITTLEGTFNLAVQALPGDVELSYADAVRFEGLPPGCTLSVWNFEPLRRGETVVHFTLAGIDTRKAITRGQGCASALQRFARTGFQARFESAIVSSPFGSPRPSSVELTVY